MFVDSRTLATGLAVVLTLGFVEPLAAKAPAPPDLSPSSLQSVQKALQNAEKNKFSVTVEPGTLKVGETATVTLTRKKGTPPTQVQVDGATQQLRVARTLDAQLTGFGFTATGVGTSEQIIQPGQDTVWEWSLQADKNGTHTIKIAVIGDVTIGETTGKKNIYTTETNITVASSFLGGIGAFVSGNWQWLWAFILVPGVGLLWKRRKSRAAPHDAG